MSWPEATLILGCLGLMAVVILVLCVVMFKLARVAQPVALSKEKTKRIRGLNPPPQRDSWQREAQEVLRGMGDDPESVRDPMPSGLDGM